LAQQLWEQKLEILFLIQHQMVKKLKSKLRALLIINHRVGGSSPSQPTLNENFSCKAESSGECPGEYETLSESNRIE